MPASNGSRSRRERWPTKPPALAILPSRIRDATPDMTNSKGRRHGFSASIGSSSHSCGRAVFTCHSQGTKNMPIW
jgi:hypothetical protein